MTAFLAAGCAQRTTKPRDQHEIRVNATAAAPLQKGQAFQVVAVEPKNESTLLYAEVARLVQNALETRGLYQAPRKDLADVVIEIEYAMAQPRAGSDRDSRAPAPRDTLVKEDAAMLRSADRGLLEKSLVITAREARTSAEGAPRILWRVELSATDTSNDFRKYLPLLAAAGIDQLGANTAGAQTVDVRESDKSVTLLKRPR